MLYPFFVFFSVQVECVESSDCIKAGKGDGRCMFCQRSSSNATELKCVASPDGRICSKTSRCANGFCAPVSASAYVLTASRHLRKVRLITSFYTVLWHAPRGNNNGSWPGCSLGPIVALTTRQPNHKVLAGAGKHFISLLRLQLSDVEAGISARVAIHESPG
jgi:hypothetical protein